MADESASTTESIVAEYRNKIRLYSGFTERCKLLIEQLIDTAGMSDRLLSVTSRTKDIDKLREKCEKRDASYEHLSYEHLSDITDLAGVRVITLFADDVDKIASLIEQQFRIDTANSIDKRKTLEPDRFGYLSIHYVCSLSDAREALDEYSSFRGLVMEVQLRSILQHAWAEIEHDLGYKSREALPADPERRFARLAGLFELADDEFIGIREELKAYAAVVPDEIRRDPSTVQIDKDSLVAYVAQDPVVRRLDTELAAIWQEELLSEPEEKYVENLVPWLRYLGLATIQDLRTALIENEKLIGDQLTRELATLGRSGNPINRGICLFRLAIVRLATEGGTKRIVDGFAAMGLNRTADLARKIVDALPPHAKPPSSS